jgi:hypothetical protein
MTQVQWFRVFGLAAIASMVTLSLAAQTGDPKDLLLKKLNEQFAPTRFTADKSGIVTSGVVVALKKDGLLVYTVTVPSAPISVYKNGKLSQGFGDMFKVGMVDGMGRPGGASSIPSKKLPGGEKVWVSGIGVENDSILVQVTTDPYDDGRYFGTLKFLVPKGTVPTPDDAVKAISEVLDVQAAQDQAGQGGQSSPPVTSGQPLAPASEVAPAAYGDIAPPPPPPPPTLPIPTIALGQSKDQVTAAFGEPVRKAVQGAKEIYVYKDMKVTFTSGKVSDVE